MLISCALEFLAGKTEWCAHVVINSIHRLQGACPKARECVFSTLSVINEGALINTTMGAILRWTTTNSLHFDACTSKQRCNLVEGTTWEAGLGKL